MRDNKTQLAFLQARDLLRKISSNSEDVIFYYIFYPKTEIKFISDSLKNVLGYSPTEVYKNPQLIENSIYPNENSFFKYSQKDYFKLLKSKKQKIEVWFKHKKGTLKCLTITVSPIFNTKKKHIGLIGSMRDVTLRNETESLLIETKNKFDLITNNANDIIAFYTYLPKDRYLYASPNIKKILGYDANELLNEPNFFTNKFIGDKKEFVKREKLIKSYQRKNIVKSLCFSFKILNKNKEEVWLENNLVPITNSKGKIEFFISIIRDITEQKLAELEVESQYLNYRNLLDNSPIAYVIIDNNSFIYVNNASVKLFKAKNKQQLLGKSPLDLFQGSVRKKAQRRLNLVYKDGKTKTPGIYKIKNAQNQEIEVETSAVLIKFNNKDCILSTISNVSEQRQIERERLKTITTETTNKRLQKEIKERQVVEKTLTEKTAHLTSILESSTHLIWTVNTKYQVTSYNNNFYKTVKQLHGIIIKPGFKIDEHLTKNKAKYVDFWYSRYEEAFKGKKLEFDKEEQNYGKKVYRKIFINPIFNTKNEVTEISCIANDITDSKIYEQRLVNQSGKLTAIFDSSHHYIWTIDKRGRLTSFNKNYFDLVTVIYNTKPFVGLVLDRGVLSNDKEYTELLSFHYKKAFSGKATSFEIETKDKHNKNVYLELFLNPIYEKDKVVEVSGIAHNITEKKLVQQKVELSLKEKEILLREIHHRVKNNMQVISSIINLQSSYVTDEYALTLLKESQNRIKTMAYIHESLYQNKSFTSVNFSDYVRTLIHNIVQSYSHSEDKIQLVLNVDELTLSLDNSIPAGLIINELITNAIKHAFPGPAKGTITFNLRCENKLVILELKDNGAGFSPDVSFENSNSLGLQLVNTLIEQIEGELKFKSEKDRGTEVTITFKM